MTFRQAVRTCLFGKFATFSGRAARSEFWWFFLFYVLLIVGAALAFMLPALLPGGGPRMGPGMLLAVAAVMALGLALQIPLWSVSVRRMHDRGWSGLWVMPVFVQNTVSAAFEFSRLILGVMPPRWRVGGMDLMEALDMVADLGFVILLVLLIFRGQEGPNRYGPDPRERRYDEDVFA